MTPDDAAGGPSADSPRASARERRRNAALIVAIGAVWLLLDQASKEWAEAELTGRPPVPVLGDLLQFRLLYNPGAAFSMGTGSTWIFTVLASVVVVVLVWQSRDVETPAWRWAFGLLLGGAGGNLTDRLLRDPGPGRGHVVDFIELPNFPVFNVADIGITSAAVLIALLALRGTPLAGAQATAQTEEAA
ncbi:MAG: signal peptidase II [Actinobacteria bacterium]|nr:signal peptidase II [Actinomycetota bacterium]